MIEKIFPGLGDLQVEGGCTCRCWCPILIEREHDGEMLQTDIFVDEM